MKVSDMLKEEGERAQYVRLLLVKTYRDLSLGLELDGVWVVMGDPRCVVCRKLFDDGERILLYVKAVSVSGRNNANRLIYSTLPYHPGCSPPEVKLLADRS